MWEVYTNFILHFTNLILFFVFYKSFSVPIKIIGFCILTTCVIEVYAAKLKFASVNNLFLYHGFAVIHYVFYSFFYYQIIRNRRIRNLILLTNPLFVILAIVNVFYFQKITDYCSYTLVVKHFLISIWVLVYFTEFFLKPGELYVYFEPFFWISAGLILCSLGNFFIEGMMDYLINKSKVIALKFYLVGVVLSYLFYLTITVSLILEIRTSKLLVKVDEV